LSKVLEASLVSCADLQKYHAALAEAKQGFPGLQQYYLERRRGMGVNGDEDHFVLYKQDSLEVVVSATSTSEVSDCHTPTLQGILNQKRWSKATDRRDVEADGWVCDNRRGRTSSRRASTSSRRTTRVTWA
jgi:hypothetical protein